MDRFDISKKQHDKDLAILSQITFWLLLVLTLARFAYTVYLLVMTYGRWKRKDFFTKSILWLSVLQTVSNAFQLYDLNNDGGLLRSLHDKSAVLFQTFVIFCTDEILE